MIYSDFHDLKISQLGFGAMRLPLLDGGAIDEEQVAQMVDLALEKGLNYFDTAYPYHGGLSELVMGKVLSRYPRDSFFLATKYPGHQLAASYDPAALFEEQLHKCRVEHFDFYLLHNVCELSLPVYEDPRWGIVAYFKEQRRLGRIRHLGFSSHGRIDNLRRFLSEFGSEMEFCQIQLNYLDWTLQEAEAKCQLLDEYRLPVWVMEPLRGGKLAKLSPAAEAKLQALRSAESAAAWAFRWLQGLPQVKVILSGMSSLEQMRQNLETFAAPQPLSELERKTMLDIAEGMKDSVPCTGCRYCCEGCPQQLDIPMLLSAYNDVRYDTGFAVGMQMDAMPDDKLPSACIGCGACSRICPQHIDIPAALRDFSARLDKMVHWADICRQREEANRRNKQRE